MEGKVYVRDGKVYVDVTDEKKIKEGEDILKPFTIHCYADCPNIQWSKNKKIRRYQKEKLQLQLQNAVLRYKSKGYSMSVNLDNLELRLPQTQ